jgi:large-conductance mechanosensitive channel
MNRLRAVVDTAEKAPEAPKGPTQEEVLIEIRDLIKQGQGLPKP